MSHQALPLLLVSLSHSLILSSSLVLLRCFLLPSFFATPSLSRPLSLQVTPVAHTLSGSSWNCPSFIISSSSFSPTWVPLPLPACPRLLQSFWHRGPVRNLSSACPCCISRSSRRRPSCPPYASEYKRKHPSYQMRDRFPVFATDPCYARPGSPVSAHPDTRGF
ncbi:hypothetical protein BC826DRAFT_612648 [Russula brevipes]|nr:hypothetical protein BC826DRAFT_612648 [Russula brevipes]